MIPRDYCVLTGKPDLEPLYTFYDFPVFMGCVEGGSAADDIRADMRWAISRETGCIQLDSVLPLDILYQASHGSGSVGKAWMEHHMAFAEFIHSYAPKSVLEIGGAHGVLPTLYHKLRSCGWAVIEPNPTPQPGCPARFIKDFFSSETDIHDIGADTFVHSHVFEHMYEPDVFIQSISTQTKEGDLHIFSVPDLEHWLKLRYYSCLNFEHTVFLSEFFIDFLLKKHGFSIIEKKRYKNGHSIFYATERSQNGDCSFDAASSNYDKNKTLFTSYIDYNKDVVRDINTKINAFDGSVFLFGAHIFSQSLMSFGLKANNIISVLDNDPSKQNLRLYGTNYIVRSPHVLKNISHAAVILKAGIYNEEIKSDILKNINPSVTFWE